MRKHKVDGGARSTRRSSRDIPEIAIFSGITDLAPGPVTIFKVAVVAGDGEAATLTIRTSRDETPLISIIALAGKTASFVPAAPALIRDRIQVHVSGAHAVGSVAYR